MWHNSCKVVLLATAPNPTLEGPQGSRLGSWSTGPEWEEREPQDPRTQNSGDGSEASAQDVSAIQLSWAGIFEKGVSLNTLKEKQHPEDTDITELRLTDTK